jgi:hypothetical protein
LKNLQKVYFKFIPSLLQFIFGLNAFESLILKLKSLFEIVKKKFVAHCQFALMALASQLIFFIFPRRPSHSPARVAHFGPSQPTEGNHLPPFIKATAATRPVEPPCHTPPMATRSCLGEAEPNHQVAPFLPPIKVTSPRLLFSRFNSKTIKVILHH